MISLLASKSCEKRSKGIEQTRCRAASLLGEMENSLQMRRLLSSTPVLGIALQPLYFTLVRRAHAHDATLYRQHYIHETFTLPVLSHARFSRTFLYYIYSYYSKYVISLIYYILVSNPYLLHTSTVVESFKTALLIGDYTLTACSTERLDFLVLTNDICICSSMEKLNKTGASLVSTLQ